ncbi:MAG TPA: FKBP-type peptidyl-prolyl cis-trans isomerase [Candidatus Paceibacterota bacterium]|nr:FKBP-type peptidyl-prolyl cis-trans isomerase [Candidatus Paceibacterota bacterium]HPT18317.1 FKBP-type peptidyl-prolyl cis-trans isomerase [Candidatus Paceibacterota bacterium]
MEKNKKNMVVWFLIVLIVIAFFVYITIKSSNSTKQVGDEQNINMNNSQVEGVKVTVLQEGTGDVVKSGDTVAVNYTGKFTDGTAFDSNIDPKFEHVQPFVFTVGAGQVIKGWDVGVEGMKIGEKRSLEIAPEFAYGENGAGEIIPPNTTLIFEVELLSIKK